MFGEIIKKSLKEVIYNHKLIRIAFFLWLMHNIFIFGDILYYINNILYYKYHLVKEGSLAIANDLINFLISQWFWLHLFVFGILFFIWYTILYPISIALMAFLLETWKIKWLKAIKHYFTVVVVNSSLALFTLSWLHIMNFFRIRIMWIADNILVKIIIWIFVSILLVASILTPYVMYSALLDNIDSNNPETRFWHAISKSANLAIWNLWITIKFILLQFFLFIRILFNLALVIWLPILIWYFFYSHHIFNQNETYLIIFWIGIILLIFILYIESIISALFFTAWYNLYKILNWKPTED